MIKKYSGAGNHFIITRDELDIPSIISFCKKEAVDGCILLSPSNTATIKMRIFNSDGTEAEMCGNGLRCVIKEMNQPQVSVETKEGIYHGCLKEGTPCVYFPQPKEIKEIFHGYFLNTGVPHFVTFTHDLENFHKQAPFYRHNKAFAPSGTNVNFAKIQDNLIQVRTFERGVEGETGSCGTGAVATAYVAHHFLNVPSPITILPGSGEKMIVDIDKEITLSGPVEIVLQTKF